ncbi:hypothetical protein ACIGB6_17110 [Paeniglutamicibacter gangotriensis]|uniref:hypothetical protein n=1 Tax=Paeniglutamicibacter gangotriensis TaxID=254787 RepID=UPI0037CB9E99
MEVSKLRGEYIDPTLARSTVAELGPAWVESKRQLKASAYRPLEIAWRVHVEPMWGKRAISEIRYSEVQTWVTALSVGDPKAKPQKNPRVQRP